MHALEMCVRYVCEDVLLSRQSEKEVICWLFKRKKELRRTFVSMDSPSESLTLWWRYVCMFVCWYAYLLYYDIVHTRGGGMSVPM